MFRSSPRVYFYISSFFSVSSFIIFYLVFAVFSTQIAFQDCKIFCNAKSRNASAKRDFFQNIRLFQRLSLFFTALAGAAVTGTAASAATATVLSAFHDRNDCGDERRDYDRKQYIINNVHMCLLRQQAPAVFRRKGASCCVFQTPRPTQRHTGK